MSVSLIRNFMIESFVISKIIWSCHPNPSVYLLYLSLVAGLSPDIWHSLSLSLSLPVISAACCDDSRREPHTRVILSHCYTLISDQCYKCPHTHNTPRCNIQHWWLSPHSPDTRVWFIVRLIHPFIARHDHLEVNKVRIYNPSPLIDSVLGRENMYLPWSSFPSRSMPMI